MTESLFWCHGHNYTLYYKLNRVNFWKESHILITSSISAHDIDPINQYLSQVILFIDGTHCDSTGKSMLRQVHVLLRTLELINGKFLWVVHSGHDN